MLDPRDIALIIEATDNPDDLLEALHQAEMDDPLDGPPPGF